ncbi:hypothetical protein ZIOFF_037697 [Zingiber officinale]|uniref:Uncharacterized protein n=1 Tax=Zingiber officinale TaxID=94328 RepID=A0A8J5GKT3_ZINOF|nr:hypothetical protein ZIOFF_037697 [Zingiber officinale]
MSEKIRTSSTPALFDGSEMGNDTGSEEKSRRLHRRRSLSPSPLPSDSRDGEERSRKHRKRDGQERKIRKDESGSKEKKRDKSHKHSRSGDGKGKKSKEKHKRSKKDSDSLTIIKSITTILSRSHPLGFESLLEHHPWVDNLAEAEAEEVVHTAEGKPALAAAVVVVLLVADRSGSFLESRYEPERKHK